MLDAVLAVLVGTELLQREREVRRREAVDRPGAEVALERREVRVLVREVRAQGLDRVAGSGRPPEPRRSRSIEPSAFCSARSASISALSVGHAGSLLAGEETVVSSCANAGPAAQYTRLIHRSAWSCSPIVSSPNRSESASTTTRPSPYCGDDGERRVRLGGRRGGVRDHLRAVGQRERAGAVEADLVHAREHVGAGAAAVGRQVRANPGRRGVGLLVVLDRRGLDLDAERLEQLVEVVAVAVVVALAEDDQAAALRARGAGWPRSRRRCSAGSRSRSSPPSAGPTGARSRARRRGRCVSTPSRVRGDDEIALLEQLRRLHVRRVLGMSGLHPLRDVRPDRPGLAVGLVEEQGRGLVRMQESHA